VFEALRRELDLPPADRSADFPAEVLAEAERVVAAGPRASLDRTDVPFVTIDPPGAMDLDQAVHLERRGDGFRVHYAIADLGVIELGGAIDTEARRRGQTIYLPDGRVPLHPPSLSEGALSLLPDQVRGAVLWTIDLDAEGAVVARTVENALVRSVARLDYEGVQSDADVGRLHPSIAVLPEVGRLRRARRVAAGALELGLPDQEVVADPSVAGGWRAVWRTRREADDWNAEISVLTGSVAARLMLDAGVGLLRTLPEPDPRDVRRFLARARTLGVDVPDGGADDGPQVAAARLLDGLDAGDPASLAVMTDATRLLRGASYEAFDGAAPTVATHAGIGAPYAQVTAPLRRLADRFATEVCLVLAAGDEVAAALRAALPDVPPAMEASDARSSRADRGVLDRVEAAMLAPLVGRDVDALVVDVDERSVDVMLLEPAVLASLEPWGSAPRWREGERRRVRVETVDVERGVVDLTSAD
jgi:exoribonuclease R